MCPPQGAPFPSGASPPPPPPPAPRSLSQITLPDVTESKIDLSGTTLEFSGKSGGKTYTANLEFFAELDDKDEGSKFEVLPRKIQFHIMKKEKDSWWPSLLKDKAKEKNQVAVDWSRYVDEDEADGKFDMSQFGSGAQGFGGDDDYGGGMGGMGGMDFGALGGGAEWVVWVMVRLSTGDTSSRRIS